MIPLKDYNPTTRRAWITLGLIAVNVFVYFLVQPHGQGNVDPQTEAITEAKFTYAHAAIPCEVTHGRPLTVAEIEDTVNTGDTNACAAHLPASQEAFPHKNVYLAVLYSMFLHASLLHIGGNMLFLWIFGNNIEDRMGWIGYPIFSVVSGLFPPPTQFVVQPNSSIPVIGASGAIAGVMGAYLVLFPRVRIRTLFIIVIIPLIRDIPAAWLLVFWLVLQFFTSPNSGVAWVAHVGGFVFGAGITLPFRNRLRRPPARPAWFYGTAA
jgi:membrane associated rhomboid family serine protease